MCHHKPQCCLNCLKQSCKADVTQKSTTTVKCPVLTCRVVVPPEEVFPFLEQKDAERFNEQLMRACLHSMKEFHWCAAPGCGSGQLVEGGDMMSNSNSSTFTISEKANLLFLGSRCDGCHVKNCVEHHVVWHEGMSCKEYTQYLAQNGDAASNHWLTTNTKKCPRCGRSIEKITGCDHMRCDAKVGGCGHEFCWLCLVDFEPIRAEGNHRHSPTCEHYAAWDPPQH